MYIFSYADAIEMYRRYFNVNKNVNLKPKNDSSELERLFLLLIRNKNVFSVK